VLSLGEQTPKSRRSKVNPGLAPLAPRALTYQFPSAETPMSHERSTWTPLYPWGPTLPRPLRDFAFREPTTPSLLSLGTPNAGSPMLRIRATCPSRNLRSRSNREIALRGFDVHAILALANPDCRYAMAKGSFAA
jgi:hypothetical protein